MNGWKLEIFKCLNLIPKQNFTLEDVNKFENDLRKVYPSNKHIKDKIRQQLQYLRDLGLVEFLGAGRYRKLWR
ncbi:MAG: Dam-replacing domain protein [Ignavibacterium sp.]